ncbi:MAG: hypothetical protein M0030_04505 [Actinomycetota bacterium]|nr:hypothetical protein [Actinomycetota bacterium]
MRFFRDPTFWGGVLVGYFLLVLFPQLNVRMMGVKASVGKA